MRADFDAIVIGGGPAGATAGALLAEAGWAVAVIEKAGFPRRKVCGECISATNLPLLRSLALETQFLALAGPALHRVGLYAGEATVEADFAPCEDSAHAWGRALEREHLDTLLLARARAAGAHVLQPWCVREVRREGRRYSCRAVSPAHGSQEIRAPLLIAAHGSWEPGRLPTQPPRTAPRASDLFAFKANFRDDELPAGLLPVLSFPGGYGGMVRCGGGRVTMACCVRRDALQRIRGQHRQPQAGEAVLVHIADHCAGAREALRAARREGPFLSCGPLRPGFRGHCRDGIWLLGNAASETHPIIGEGISMAMQSAFMLCGRLIAKRAEALDGNAWPAIGHDYAQQWHRTFSARIRAATLFAHVAMRPPLVAALLPLFRKFPGLLTQCTRVSGKTTAVIGPPLFEGAR